MCSDTKLHPALFEENTLNASFDNSIIKNKSQLGSYKVENQVLFIDHKDAKLELEYKSIDVCDQGFPMVAYDGSLMQAIEWYVKWRYYTILMESSIISQTLVTNAEKQYAWYIGQYTSKVEMLSYDEAITMAHTWQRLIDTRNRNNAGHQFREFTGQDDHNDHYLNI